jgi:hypothetical protein
VTDFGTQLVEAALACAIMALVMHYAFKDRRHRDER